MDAGTLFLVATPLGNLEDLSPRARRCLCEAEIVYAEDTRRSRILLDHIGSNRPIRSLREHNERSRIAEILDLLGRSKSVCLVSDAGTPAVSDPGSELVREVVQAGYRVSPLPGPSALAAALSVAGFAESSTDVLFLGFIPATGEERRAALDRVKHNPGIIVLFEAPHRIAATAADLAALEPGRRVCVCRELSKVYEEIRHTTVAGLVDFAAGEVRGELTLVLGPSSTPARTADEATVDAALQRCLDSGMSSRDASSAVALALDLPRRMVYARCQKLHKAD